ncbi:hypothetical protein B0H21DRAFT_752883, partial [Amylocystis lapponica]
MRKNMFALSIALAVVSAPTSSAIPTLYTMSRSRIHPSLVNPTPCTCSGPASACALRYCGTYPRCSRRGSRR